MKSENILFRQPVHERQGDPESPVIHFHFWGFFDYGFVPPYRNDRESQMWTGYTLNGEKVFEGDIIETKYFTGVVQGPDVAFDLLLNEPVDIDGIVYLEYPIDLAIDEGGQIIGNTVENPELVPEGEKEETNAQ